MFEDFFDFIAWLHGGGKTADEVCREWHTFWIGCFEMICFSIPARFPRTAKAIEEMSEEEHYYHWGRGTGVMFWGVVIAGVVARFMG